MMAYKVNDIDKIQTHMTARIGRQGPQGSLDRHLLDTKELLIVMLLESGDANVSNLS